MPDLGQIDYEAPPQQPREVLPVGWYDAQIVESDVVPTKAGTGDRLVLTWEILTGQKAGRQISDGINIRNPSEKAQAIGQSQLSAVRVATGVARPQASEELHGKPCQIHLKIVKGDGTWPDKNEVSGYRQINAGASTPAAPPAQQEAPRAAPASPGRKPWAR